MAFKKKTCAHLPYQPPASAPYPCLSSSTKSCNGCITLWTRTVQTGPGVVWVWGGAGLSSLNYVPKISSSFFILRQKPRLALNMQSFYLIPK